MEERQRRSWRGDPFLIAPLPRGFLPGPPAGLGRELRMSSCFLGQSRAEGGGEWRGGRDITDNNQLTGLVHSPQPVLQGAVHPPLGMYETRPPPPPRLMWDSKMGRWALPVFSNAMVM